jgi:hypothetical protein
MADPAFPALGAAILLYPCSFAQETRTAAPRALKERVGLDPSQRNSTRGRPREGPHRREGTMGASPSPRVSMLDGSRMGSSGA